ncbi:MAG: DNA recombination protein RmuC, partial [Elusimicrobiaceae bacterium]|nr:DNA recombination protein RmuC [Elusimicrobiaceae bacterium]
EDVLTAAGFRKGIEFDTQVSFSTQTNERKQPDFIVHLPNQRDLVIDSKMSLTAYLQWQAAANEEEKQKYLKEHIQSVEKHIKELATQDYTQLLPHEKLDFTFMFIPIEYAYFLAIQAKPDLNELAHKHRIAIVTASNLFSVLQIAENLWRMERGSQLVDKIFKTAQEMLERTGRFSERMEEIRNRITQLDKAYEDADKALRGKQGIVSSAKQLEELHVKSARKLPQLIDEQTDNSLLKKVE